MPAPARSRVPGAREIATIAQGERPASSISPNFANRTPADTLARSAGFHVACAYAALDGARPEILLESPATTRGGTPVDVYCVKSCESVRVEALPPTSSSTRG